MQQTNFPFEVLIYDDASTDGTADIVREFEQKYPDIIKPIYQTENQYSQGKSISKRFVYPLIKGEYVAYCEGDDYWLDPLKLQKQVDFLDAHPDCSISFHPVKVIWDDHSRPEKLYPDKKILNKIGGFDFNSLLKINFIQTNSVVYRWCLTKDNYDLLKDDILPGDWFLHLLHAQVGKIGFMPDVMSVYRKHAQSVWFGAGESLEWFKRNGLRYMNFLKAVEEQFHVSKQAAIYELAWQLYFAAIRCGNQALQDQLCAEFSFLKRPSKFALINKILYFVGKKMNKLLPERIIFAGRYRFRALRLYLYKWV